MNEPLMCKSKNAPMPIADYAHAIKVPLGNGKSTLYLCGMGPREIGKQNIPGVTLDINGQVKDYDIKTQARNVFKNINTVIIDAGGQGLRDLVDIQVFLIDIDKDFQPFNTIWKEYMSFEDGWRPARTTVQVSALPLKEIFVELKCIAIIKEN